MVVVARVPDHIGINTGDMVMGLGLSRKGENLLAATLIAFNNGVKHG